VSRILQRLALEPAMLGGFATSILPALVVLGLFSVSGEQMAAIVVLINATVALLVRVKVQPSKSVVAAPVEQPAVS
jgi:hypothetical protein